ncbi:hypothetical protein [Pseudomonas sp. RGM2987]|uniref:hypothetical protein n=1 Tax=Pseudomonas sp. RGM2987 TaxID=2930090 RepID=UPI001FD670CB|nr:hypothetical protein [Pseudomonas sp. RGM2987]MCJ8207169.1 hypothetical protein [Pseudomonas sp. RGM2987]
MSATLRPRGLPRGGERHADAYWYLHTQPRSAWTQELDLQPRSAWTQELDLRPFKEPF